MGAETYWQTSRWHIEGEYMRKNYAHNSFTPVTAVEAFKKGVVPSISEQNKIVLELVAHF